MGKLRDSIFARSLAFLALATLIISAVSAPIMAGEEPQEIYERLINVQALLQTDSSCANGHVSDGGTIVKEPTASAPGEAEYKCTCCGVLLREEIIPVITKRDTPHVTFDTSSFTLKNIPDNSAVLVNGRLVSQNATDKLNLISSFSDAGDYIITVVANATDSMAASSPQELYVQKPGVPSDIQTIVSPDKDGIGYISGVNPDMEYTPAGKEDWKDCAMSTQPVKPGTYLVRYKATELSITSDVVKAYTGESPEDKLPDITVIPTPDVKDNQKNTEKTIKKAGQKKQESTKNTDTNPENKIVVENKLTREKDKERPILFTSELSWESIEKIIEKSKVPITIILNKKTKVPSTVFVKAAEANTPLILITTARVVWRIEPEDIDIDTIKSYGRVNLGVESDTPSIPFEQIARVEDIAKNHILNKTFDIKHDGDLGFTAKFTVTLSDVNEGDYANLFRYNLSRKDLEYVESAAINYKDEASFSMSHASCYMIVVSSEKMSQADVKELPKEEIEEKIVQDQQPAIEMTYNKQKTSKTMSPVTACLIVTVVAILVSIAIFRIGRRKDNYDVHERKK